MAEGISAEEWVARWALEQAAPGESRNGLQQRCGKGVIRRLQRQTTQRTDRSKENLGDELQRVGEAHWQVGR